jgi:hypothetical protein
MGLFSLKGTIISLGQSTFWPDGQIYSWIEIQDETGQRFNVSKVFATNAVLSLVDNDYTGEFFLEEIKGKKRLFGVKLNTGAAAYDELDARARVGGLLFLQGIPMLLVFGLGLIFMVQGLFYLFTSNNAARRAMFYGTDIEEASRLRKQEPIRI